MISHSKVEQMFSCEHNKPSALDTEPFFHFSTDGEVKLICTSSPVKSPRVKKIIEGSKYLCFAKI